MNFKIYYPTEKLSTFINYYWVLEPSSGNEELKPERVIPAGYLQMFFHYRTPFVIDNNEVPESYFCGQLTKYKDVVLRKNTGMIAVVFHPNSAKAFIHLNINELTNKSVDLKDVYAKGEIINLNYEIKKTNDLESKVRVVESFLLSKFFVANKYQYALIQQSVNLINQKHGTCSIKQIAEKIHVGHRHFERLFKSYVGITPKLYSNIIRFSKAHNDIEQGKKILDVLYECGYFDQAHFIKDYKRFTGITPKQSLFYKGNNLSELK